MRNPTRLHNPQAEESQFQLRLIVAYGLVIILFLVLLARLVWLQVWQNDHYLTLAQNNRISLVPVLPNRGEIIDRYGRVLAQNYSAYTLELTTSKIVDLEATLAYLKTLADITPRDERQFKRLAAESRNFEPVPLKVKLSEEDAARIAAQSWRLPGVEIKARLFRDYPYKELTSHVLGYIGRINQRDKERLEEEDKTTNYKGSNYIGKTGLEAEYEDDLHGKVGFEEVETDSAGRAVRVLRRQPPVNGNTLKLALDIRLQEVADKLFANRRGALVAIEPSSGGVLAFLSKPGFDPNLFIDGIDTQTWNQLNTDWQRPMVNRALRGTYPPGSTFKPFMALAALESGSITQQEIRPAPGAFSLPGSSHLFRDSRSAGNGVVNLQRAIEVSSDTFFYKLAWEMGIDKIHPYLAQFGLGSKTGIDLDGEASGILPSREWKAKRFARASNPAARRWLPADVVSVAIGQGFNTYTPLQMAFATAILANDGVVYKPHLVQEVTDSQTGKIRRIEPSPSRKTPFKPSDIDYVKRGMVGVMQRGTGARLGAGLQYSMAGKTGTAQVVQIQQGAKYNAGALAEQHRDHSWFIAFAPAENPKVAVAVIVENAGFGAAAAGPVVRQFLDFYLLGKVPAGIEPLTVPPPVQAAQP